MAQRAGDTRNLDEHEAHLAKIRTIVRDWQEGRISVSAKRGMIADLNAVYYGESLRGDAGSDITRPPRYTDEVMVSLADRAMVPDEAAGAALSALRNAGFVASQSEDLDEARQILAEGREAYETILRSAR